MRDKPVDLRSDTVTHPTPEMREAMYRAEVGDDVLQEDPTTNRLEQRAAQLLGKEAALFVPSGTFGNELALCCHCDRGAEVILSESTHIVQHEAGAPAILPAVQLRTFVPERSYPVWEEIEPRIRKLEDIHFPVTALISLENALSEGDVMPLTEMERVHAGAHSLGVAVHLDGARIFNAAAFLGVKAGEVARFADSVMFCLSKGLCAPVGSLLAGTSKFVDRARKFRKIMGGGMRQTGFLAAAGLVALESMTGRVEQDRRTAGLLADALDARGCFEIKPAPPRINMIFVRFKEGDFTGKEAQFVDGLAKRGFLTYPPDDRWLRIVTHYYVCEEDIRRLASVLDEVLLEITTR